MKNVDKIKIFDLVQLKSGGIEMVVSKIEKNIATVAFSDGKKIIENKFLLGILKKSTIVKIPSSEEFKKMDAQEASKAYQKLVE